MTGIPALDVFVGVSIVVTGLVALAKLWRVLSRITDAFEDWQGEPARPGYPGRPGVMERLSTIEDSQTGIEAELKTNHGSSLRDAVNVVSADVKELKALFDEHLVSTNGKAH